MAGLKFGQLLTPIRYSERTTTTVLGPVAIAGSTDVETQRAPAFDRTWPTRWGGACATAPPVPSDTTMNSSRCARRPVSTMVLRPLTWPPAATAALGGAVAWRR